MQLTAEITLELLYARACNDRTAIAAHLPRLRALAMGLDDAIEFGVKRGPSASALLLGAQRVTSYDLVETPEARALATMVGPRWRYRIGDSRTAPVEPCDLLFIDSLHTFAQCDAELTRHADAVRRWLVFHDVGTFGEIGADGESGRHLWNYAAHPGQSVPPRALGIRPAIDALMIRDPSWRIASRETESHGLLVLERRP
jgi:hypothetical protein